MGGVIPSWSRRRVLGGGSYLCQERLGWSPPEEGMGGGGRGDLCWKGLSGKLLGEFGGATDFEKYFIGKNFKHTQIQTVV